MHCQINLKTLVRVQQTNYAKLSFVNLNPSYLSVHHLEIQRSNINITSSQFCDNNESKIDKS